MKQDAIWIPPSLCGCQLRITADWHEFQNGSTYRHPIPFTIENIQIVSVCSGHQINTQSMPDTSHLFDTPDSNSYVGSLAAKYNVKLSPIQNRGYLSYPIDKPTPAQCLYTFLSQYGGQKWSLPCGCSAHQFIDESKNTSYLQHPQNTNKCIFHGNDLPDMTNAKADYITSQAVITNAINI